MARPKPMIQVEGAKELARALKKAGDESLQEALKAAHRASADEVADVARPLIPSVSGTLASSMRTASTIRSGRVAIGRKSVPYAGPIHFGWPARNIAPQPFLYDALDRRGEHVLDAFKERMDAIADQVAKDTP